MILVTGANGFIGREVCRTLAAHGDGFVATDRNNEEPSRMLAHYGTDQSRFAAGDVCDAEWLAELFQTHAFDAIIHLASMRNRESQARPADAMRVNIGGSLNLLKLAQQHGVSRFVYGSSISVYGPKPYARYGEVAETEQAAPANVYGLAKRYVEMAGEHAAHDGGFSFVALRIAMVVGSGVVSTASMWRGEIFDRLRATQPHVIDLPYERDEVLPLIHVSDVAEMLRAMTIAVSPGHALYNTPAEHVTCADLADAVSALNPHLTFSFRPTGQSGASGARGDPEKIDGRRFTEEFGYRMAGIKERLNSQLFRG